jgi:DNA polymerase III subunit epsilon
VPTLDSCASWGLSMRVGQWAAAVAAAMTGLVTLAWLVGWGLRLPGRLAWPAGLLLVGILVGLFGLLSAVAIFRRQRRRLDRLCGALLIAGGAGRPLPRPIQGRLDEVDRLQQAAANLIGRERERRARLDRRVEALLGGLEEGVIACTAEGQVSLINAAGKALLGGDCRPGSSLFKLFERESLAVALERAAGGGPARLTRLRSVAGGEIEIRISGLGLGGGALLRIAHDAVGEGLALFEQDLSLHDQAPPASAPRPDTLLAQLPAVSLDTETTGLDVRRDRMISVGAVQLHGAEVFPAASFDRLVNPGRRIPPVSTAVHGITDAMVTDAPAFAAIAAELAGFCGPRVWIGHNIGFDLAILRRETACAGLPWSEPPALDTLRLYAALHPRAPDVELEAVAADLGVDSSGRHTALGDALMTAEVYRRMLPMLAEAGVRTLGEALAFAKRPRQILRLQRALGW